MSDWQPGDPVYPDQEPKIRAHCGPCLVAWTADTDRCPDCGELSTEALRAAIDRVRARHPLQVEDWPIANGGPQQFCRECERPYPCHDIAALEGVSAARSI